MSMWQLKRPDPGPQGGTSPAAVQAAAPAAPAKPGVPHDVDKLMGLKVRIHQQLIERLNLAALEKLPRDQVAAMMLVSCSGSDTGAGRVRAMICLALSSSATGVSTKAGRMLRVRGLPPSTSVF